MNINWGTFAKPDGTEYIQIEVSDESDWRLFNRLAKELNVRLGGKWTEQLDGLDQRYWDLVVGSGRITLHLEHYLGITVYPTDGAKADEESIRLLRDAYMVLENYQSV